MKTLLLIYNPQSGDKSFRYAIDACAQVFQEHDYAVMLHRAQSPGDIDAVIAGLDKRCGAVVTAGGDGTLNQTVGALLRHRRDIPLGVIPAGTANDFANYLKMPHEPEEAARAIMTGRAIKADVGIINGQPFINVCGAGLFTTISQQVDGQVKDSLGMLAYYLTGVGQLPRFVPFPVRITTPDATYEDYIYLFLALNGSGAGGFGRLSPMARIDDGLLDFIAVKAVSLRELALLFVKILRGDFLDDNAILFLRTRSVAVEVLSNEQPVCGETDVDGERGPDLPVKIECVPDALTLLVPEAYR